ncbi:Aste57867_15454 [Aphanomyces stellatus]|uniref:Aste57867_15454 protein n=1 Tax=Aphanomyces stellatus TaxID=120398 RepID=A0A485L3R4_9STRA|nr:hypothetical protein As57867_015398 [Aphanomyces stellatus]VFT92256.1 Aste57867_15454 [Aphanomyces stellatus]
MAPRTLSWQEPDGLSKLAYMYVVYLGVVYGLDTHICLVINRHAILQLATSMEYKAIVLGGTGAVGRELIKLLAASNRCNGVVALTRRPIASSAYATTFPGLQNETKLVVDAVDFDKLKLDDFAKHNADACFSCLGTTRADAGSDAAFIKVDLEYVSNAAALCKQAKIPYFGLLSASNAAKDSWFLYPRTKGLAEDAIEKTHFVRTGIFRPGMINRGHLARTAERIGNVLLPSFTVSAAAIARAMMADYEANAHAGTTIVSMAEIKSLETKQDFA